jgi:hypothetical protein
VAPIATAQLRLPPAASGILDLGRMPELADLPAGFHGWMRLTSTTPIGAESSIQVDQNPRAAAAFEAVPMDQAARQLFVPLFRNAYFGTTGISVVNPGDEAVDVTVTYHGAAEAPGCAGQVITHNGGRPVTIPALSGATFYQGGATPETGAPGLPVGCYGGAVVAAQGTGGVIAVVEDVAAGDATHAPTAAAYMATGADQGARRIAVPLFRNHHTPADLVSGIRAMNLADDGPAHATVTFYDPDGNVLASQSTAIAPQDTAGWYAPAVPGLRAGLFGSALLTSDRPLAAMVTDMSLNGSADTVIYSGLPADDAAALRPSAWRVPSAPENGQ